MLSRKHGLIVLAVILIAISLYFLFSRKSNLLDTVIDSKDLPNKEKANATQQFVKTCVNKAENGATHQELNMLRNGNEYLIGYNHDGILLVHGVSTDVFCDREFPTCNAKGKKLIGKNLYDFKTVGGVYEVRLWLDIARRGGGWAAAYWKDASGNFKPKYYYIQGVPNSDLILASGYFA